MTERDFFTLKIPEHICSIDVEAYECPICAIRLEQPEVQVETKVEESEENAGTTL
jgi:hypothetical protein